MYLSGWKNHFNVYEMLADLKDAKLKSFHSYILSDTGNEMLRYFKYANTISHFVYGTQSNKLNRTQSSSAAIYTFLNYSKRLIFSKG
jgi:flavoprotein